MDSPQVGLMREGENRRCSTETNQFTQAGAHTIPCQVPYADDCLSDPVLVPVVVPTAARHWHLY